MATTTSVGAFRKGAAFLLEDTPAEEIFTREHLSEEHIAIERTVEEFWANEVEPNLPAIRQKKAGVAPGCYAVDGRSPGHRSTPADRSAQSLWA